MSEEIEFTESSGNIFEDLGFENPEEWKTKAIIAGHILHIIESRTLSESTAAELLGISQSDVSDLDNGQLERFTIDRLFRFLGALDQHVDISIVPQSKSAAKDAITVHAHS